MHGDTRHARKYPTVKKVPRNTQCNISTLLPDPYLPATQLFFSKPDPYQPNIEKKKKLPVGPCLSEPANSSSTSTKIIVMSPQQEGGSQYYMIIDHPQWKGRSGTPRRQIKTHHKTRYSCVQCKSFSGNLVKLEL